MKVSAGLDIPYLHGYWERMLRLENAARGALDFDHTLLCGLRLGILETMRFLNSERPCFEDFEAWIVERNDGAVDDDGLQRLRRALEGEHVGSEIGSLDDIGGLSETELAHWGEHGYVVVKNAVSKAEARAAELAIYDYLKMDPATPETWYRNPQGHSIWVAMLRHPAFWANRRSPRMVKAFAQLWGREDLWVTLDQGGLNPPEREGWQFPGPRLHWDTTLAAPHYFGLQGILYLADTEEDQGAFCCVPGFHRRLQEWLDALPAGVRPRDEALRTLEMKPIAAEAGDMVIWHQSLPHGSSPNRAARPRVAQYITMKPTRWEHHGVWL